jgi:hypothetical protein
LDRSNGGDNLSNNGDSLSRFSSSPVFPSLEAPSPEKNFVAKNIVKEIGLLEAAKPSGGCDVEGDAPGFVAERRASSHLHLLPLAWVSNFIR